MNFSTYIFPIVIFFTLNSFSSAQSITWQRFYDGAAHKGDVGYDICRTTGGNFCVVGYSENMNSRAGIYVLKIDNNGDTLWTYYFGGYSPGRSARCVVATSDGGCVLSGSGDSTYAIKMSADGNVVWYKKYNAMFPLINKIIESNDGGYIACGYLGLDGFAFKIDSMGNRLWERVYNHLNSIFFSSMIQSIDTGYIIAGSFLENDTGKALLLKINESGDLIWTKKFAIPNYKSMSCTNIEIIDDNYVIAGSTVELLPGNQTFRRNYFARVNSDGDVYFSKVIGFRKSNTLITFAAINNNRFLFCGSYDSATFNTCVKTILTDSAGNVYREKNISNGFLDFFTSVLPVDNGDIIFCGLTQQQTTAYDIYLVRSDSSFNFPPPIAVGNNQEIIPTSFKLFQNYPNPFNPATKIRFSLPENSHIKLNIYNSMGQLVQSLVNKDLSAGVYETEFDGTNLASGVYFYTLTSNSYSQTKKMVLLK